MELNIGMALHGFTVTNIRPIPGKAAELVQMVYGKTGTPLAWVKSQEENKLFSIAFKTLPEDSTGVFHILEHSVLCGSAKYPVKEPFVELLKSSMNTFLNAMTFPDKTMYPVSSRNEQDYLNLTEVYLDAVFAPKILTNPNIFYQEGWHYEEDGDGLKYNGVVFNEMKGAMSGVDGVIEQAVQDMLFPDSIYGHNSGGDPKAIPDLTYEQFLASYRRYYHPTNAFIFLDGNIPVERTLALIESYLENFDMGSVEQIALQAPKAGELTVTYEAAPEEDLAEKSQLVLSRIMGSWEDKTRLLAAEVLSDVLCGTNDSPIKRAILSAGLGQDVTMGVVDGVFQPWITLRVHNMNDANAPQILELIRTTVAEQVEQGIDKQELTATINALAFRTKDMHEPQGLIRCIQSMNSWLYGGDPMMYLTYDDAFDTLREMAAGDGFEKLARELLLEEGLSILHAVADLDHGKKLRQQEADRLAAEQAAMSEAALAQVKETAAAFTAWQQTPDTIEAIETLPVLSLDQISPEPPRFPTQADTVNGITVLRHETSTNGIVHVNGYFNISDLTLEELTAVSFMAGLLGRLPTADYDAAQLQKQIKTHLGGLGFDVDVFAQQGQRETCTPCLSFRCSVLKENLEKAWELIPHILTATDFDQPQRIREILLQTESDMQQMAMGSGHRFANTCTLSHFSAAGAVSEALGAYSPIQWVHGFVKNFDGQFPAFLALCRKVMDKAVATARLTLGVTEDSATDVAPLLARLPEGSACADAAHYETKLPKKLGVRIPAQVSYAGLGCHLDACGEGYRGTAQLLSNILSLSYLWNMVRVQGGAYGAGMNIRRSGGLSCHSYRDPSPAKTLETCRNMADFLRSFRDSGEKLDKFIISTIANTEPLLSPRQMGNLADGNWICGSTYEAALRERKELLEADWDGLLSWCGLLEQLREKGTVCVVGHSEALNACEAEGLTLVDL